MEDNKLNQNSFGKDQTLDAGQNIGGNIDSGNVTESTGFDRDAGVEKDLGADIGGNIRSTESFDKDLGTGMRTDVADERGSVTSSNDDMGSFGGAKKEGFMDKLGDAVEGIGHKISEAGAPGLGQKIHDLGDKLEEKHDNPRHPHDV